MPLLEQTIIMTVDVSAIGVQVLKVRPGAPKWTLEIIKYLYANELPDEQWEAQKIKINK